MKITIANPSRAEMDKFLAGVVGVVEASSYESLCLWKEYHQERGRPWVSGGSGPMVQVGELADMPVCCALLVNEVDGHRILFMDVTSQVTDSRMVERWLEQNMPVTAFENGDPRRRLNRTDAMNFHNVFPRPAIVDTRRMAETGTGSGRSPSGDGSRSEIALNQPLNPSPQDSI